MTVFNLPDLGEGLKEAEIVEWHAGAGDDVETGDPLVSVETEKSIVEIPSPQTGRIQEVYAEAGGIVLTGQPLVEFANEDDQASPDSVTVVGHIETGDQSLKETATAERRRSGAAVKTTPSVRALARKLDVDLGIVTPTGPDGTISADDIRRVADRFKDLGPIELLRGVRRVMAVKMMQSGTEVVPATIFDDADVEHWPPDTDTTIRLIKALVEGCKAEPALNAWFDGHSMGRRVLEQVDVAVAMDTVDGLFTPVVRNVGTLGDSSIAAAMETLKAAVGRRTITAREMSGYSITLSNFGMIGGRYAVPVVLPPTVAILAAGRIESQPVVVSGAVFARRLLPLSLSFDHRAVTGGEAARFLAAAISELESA